MIPNLSRSYRHEVYRKLIHLSSLWIPLIIYFLPLQVSLLIFGVLLSVDVLIEYGNFRRWKTARNVFNALFCKSLRNSERSRLHFVPSGGIYVLASAFICAALFSKIIAAIALCVMLVADTMAALIGKAIGKHKIYKHKSWEGSTAFFLSAVSVCILFNPLFQFSFASIFACAAATVLEAIETKIKLDDNLTVPLAVGTILTLLS